MSTFKKAEVVMLPHNNIDTLLTLYKTASGKPLHLSTNLDIISHHTNQHLYIISDDEIKEGDWFINDLNQIKKCTSRDTEGYIDFEGGFNTKPSSCKKIIATTDTTLKITISPYLFPEGGACQSRDFLLPQPSQQFIEKYIEEYNKGNIITDVLVEYELISNEEYFGNTVNPDDDVPYFDERLKINPKDNSINICFID